MMALLLTSVLLRQNTPIDTTAKSDTTIKSSAASPSSPSKGTLRLTFLITNPTSDSFQESADGEKELLPAYQQYIQLYAHQDKDAVKNLVTSDFVWLQSKERKPLRNEQAVQELLTMFRSWGLTSTGRGQSDTEDIQVTIKKLFVKKDKAVAYIEERITSKVPVSKAESKWKTMSSSVTIVHKHTWSKTSLGWKLQAME